MQTLTLCSKVMSVMLMIGSHLQAAHIETTHQELESKYARGRALTPAIVINEIMKDPSAVSDTYGEYIELFNAESSEVDIDGWILRDSGSDFHRINNGAPLLIAAGGYLVVGRCADSSSNGGYRCDYQYASFTLRNSNDQIILMADSITVVDSVSFDDGIDWPDPAGASMELHNPHLDNTVGSYWYKSFTPFGAGDLGTPGAANIPPLTPLARIAAEDSSGIPLLLDSVVTTCALVTALMETSPGVLSITAQDREATAGISIYDSLTFSAVSGGDEIAITGYVGQRNGETVLERILDRRILSSGNTLDPIVVTCADLADTLGERYETILIRIENATTSAAFFPANDYITVSDGVHSVPLFTPLEADYAGLHIVAASFPVMGICRQEDASPPYWHSYMVVPRHVGDVGYATDVVPVNGEKVPAAFILHQSYPNPFNPRTRISYQLPRDCRVRLEIFNILGAKVITLIDRFASSGCAQIDWDGCDEYGVQVGSGIYFIRLEAGDVALLSKVSLLR